MGDNNIPIDLPKEVIEEIREVSAKYGKMARRTPQPGWWNAKDFIAIEGCAEYTAYKRLRKMVKEGILLVEKVGLFNYYKKNPDYQPDTESQRTEKE